MIKGGRNSFELRPSRGRRFIANSSFHSSEIWQAARSGSQDGAGFLPPWSADIRLCPNPELVAGLSTGVMRDLGRVSARVGSARVEGSCRPIATVGGRSKRIFDVVVAGIALILLTPLMIMIAALVKMRMGGPVIYAHPRVGLKGVPFRCLKFRSMVVDGDEVLQRHLASDPAADREWRETRKLKNDPRVTQVGKLLRKYSLDELPQLINVLRGDMSCVGPRPVVAAELDLYGPRAKYYLSVRPGLTGMWQVSGRNLLSYSNRVALDCHYVRRWSLSLDIALLVLTIPALVAQNTA
jgi:exopolysaccharide production protein ExoY